MIRNGHNYSRKNDRIGPGVSHKSKSGNWVTKYKYVRSATEYYYGKNRYSPAYNLPTAPFIVCSILIIILYLCKDMIQLSVQNVVLILGSVLSVLVITIFSFIFIKSRSKKVAEEIIESES